MLGCLKWKDFKRAIQRAYPRIHTNLELPLDD